mgnify:CR=1 FL=1
MSRHSTALSTGCSSVDVMPLDRPTVAEADELADTGRGAGGFGSTGT